MVDGCRFRRNVKWKEMEAEVRAVVVKILMFSIPASELLGERARAAHLAFFLSQSATSSSCLVGQVNLFDKWVRTYIQSEKENLTNPPGEQRGF